VKDTHTKPSSLRIPEAVKKAAQRRAAEEGRTLTDVVVAFLREYGAQHKV
jgi:antitoxin component of RelBE/YafQ-DinJ toxin-antitoxin module